MFVYFLALYFFIGWIWARATTPDEADLFILNMLAWPVIMAIALLLILRDLQQEIKNSKHW